MGLPLSKFKCLEPNNIICYWDYPEPRRLGILKILSKLQLTKEISYTCASLQIIKAHWEDPWPILGVLSPDNRSINKDNTGPEVNNLENFGRNIIGSRKIYTFDILRGIKCRWEDPCQNLSVLNSITEDNVESIQIHRG